MTTEVVNLTIKWRKALTTPKGITQMLNGIDKIEGLTDEQQTQINALAQGLSDKNNDLLGKISTGKEQASGTAAEVEALRLFKQNSDVKSAEDAQSYTDAKVLTQTAHDTEMLKLSERITGFEQGERTRLITDGIRSELTELKVNPLHSATTAAYFESMSQVVDGKAMIGDKTQSEFIKEWAQTDSGKASCLAQNNLGGDGGKGTLPGAKSNKDYKDMNIAEQTAYLKTVNPQRN